MTTISRPQFKSQDTDTEEGTKHITQVPLSETGNLLYEHVIIATADSDDLQSFYDLLPEVNDSLDTIFVTPVFHDLHRPTVLLCKDIIHYHHDHYSRGIQHWPDKAKYFIQRLFEQTHFHTARQMLSVINEHYPQDHEFTDEYDAAIVELCRTASKALENYEQTKYMHEIDWIHQFYGQPYTPVLHHKQIDLDNHHVVFRFHSTKEDQPLGMFHFLMAAFPSFNWMHYLEDHVGKDHNPHNQYFGISTLYQVITSY